jgi:hypothetical protein
VAHVVVGRLGFPAIQSTVPRQVQRPAHFFWGSFDLAVSRFSGRRAPERPSADAMTREAYSHEVSVGFWPGSGEIK